MGFNKKCTVMPDEVWVQSNMSPVGSERDWKNTGWFTGVKWKLVEEK